MAMTKPRKLYPMKEVCNQTGMAYVAITFFFMFFIVNSLLLYAPIH
jgi:hypothetical protein